MTDEDLRKLRELAAAATPGPWNVTRTAGDPFDVGRLCMVVDASDQQVSDCFDNTPGHRSDRECEANATFIATAREAVPALVAEVERLRPLAADRWALTAFRDASDEADTLIKDRARLQAELDEQHNLIACLSAALTEALDSWEGWAADRAPGLRIRRIAELRKLVRP